MERPKAMHPNVAALLDLDDGDEVYDQGAGSEAEIASAGQDESSQVSSDEANASLDGNRSAEDSLKNIISREHSPSPEVITNWESSPSREQDDREPPSPRHRESSSIGPSSPNRDAVR